MRLQFKLSSPIIIITVSPPPLPIREGVLKDSVKDVYRAILDHNQAGNRYNPQVFCAVLSGGHPRGFQHSFVPVGRLQPPTVLEVILFHSVKVPFFTRMVGLGGGRGKFCGPQNSAKFPQNWFFWGFPPSKVKKMVQNGENSCKMCKKKHPKPCLRNIKMMVFFCRVPLCFFLTGFFTFFAGCALLENFGGNVHESLKFEYFFSLK
jgi:hypothetical protein